MDESIKERVKQLLEASDTELHSLARAMFWSNKPSWNDLVYVEGGAPSIPSLNADHINLFMQFSDIPTSIVHLRREVESLSRQKRELVIMQNFSQAAVIRDREKLLQEEIKRREKNGHLRNE